MDSSATAPPCPARLVPDARTVAPRRPTPAGMVPTGLRPTRPASASGLALGNRASSATCDRRNGRDSRIDFGRTVASSGRSAPGAGEEGGEKAMRNRSTLSTGRGCAATVVVTALMMAGVSACGGEETVACTGGAYEVECHPVAPTAESASGSTAPARTPSGTCPSDLDEFHKAVRNRSLDWACPLPSPLTPPLETTVPLPPP